MRRRSFFVAAGSVALSRKMPGRNAVKAHLGCQTNAWPINPQDFSTFLAVIQKLKDWGYEGFETGFANVQAQFGRPAEAKSKIDAIGIQFFGVHIFLAEYDPQTRVAPAELYERVARGGASLGAGRLILSGAAGGDPAGRKAKAAALNRAADFAAKTGLKFGYHNHTAEFENNGSEIEFLLRETNPATVGFLVDAGHAFRAGANVPAFLRKHSHRIIGLHLRDFRNGEQVPLGAGDFPLRALVDAIRESGWDGWALNEEERLTSKPGDAAAKPAHDALFRAFREGA